MGELIISMRDWAGSGWAALLVSLSLSPIHACSLGTALWGFWLRNWKVSVSSALNDGEKFSSSRWGFEPLDRESTSICGRLLSLVGQSTVKPQISLDLLEFSGLATQPFTQPQLKKCCVGNTSRALGTLTVSTITLVLQDHRKLCCLSFSRVSQLQSNKILRWNLQLGNAPK